MVKQSECEAAIQKIRNLPNTEVPRFFTQHQYTSDVGTQIQSRWSSKHCVILVSSIRSTGVAKLRLSDVADRAVNVLTECVNKNKYPLGGSGSIGPDASGFYVKVMGIGGPVDSDETAASDPIVQNTTDVLSTRDRKSVV